MNGDDEHTPWSEFYAMMKEAESLTGEARKTKLAAALGEVTARREIHWTEAHPGLNPDVDFVDCATCGTIDNQEWRAKRALLDPFAL